MKIFQIDGQGNSGFFAADLADGIDQARVVWNPHIMNMSLGIAPSGQVSSAISRALTLGRGGLGIVVVGSSGNDASSANPGSVGFPASVNGVIAVGAVTQTGERAPYSQGGSRLDVVAPSSFSSGAQVYCSSDGPPTTAIAFASCFGSGLATGYVRFGGTSAAAPQVAAIAAMVLTQFPSMSAAAVRDRIRANADPFGSQNEYGSGKANAYLSVVGRLTASVSPTRALVPAGVVTRTCSAGNGVGGYTYRWFLSYSGDEAGLQDFGTTSPSLSFSMNSGDSFMIRCVATDGVQTATVTRSVSAQ